MLASDMRRSCGGCSPHRIRPIRSASWSLHFYSLGAVDNFVGKAEYPQRRKNGDFARSKNNGAESGEKESPSVNSRTVPRCAHTDALRVGTGRDSGYAGVESGEADLSESNIHLGVLVIKWG